MAKQARRVVQCSLDGEELRYFESALEASKAMGGSYPTSIFRSIQYGRPAFRFRWKYEGEELKPLPCGTPGRRRRVISINTLTKEEITFISLSEASRSLGIGISTIESSLETGGVGKGYLFRYEGEESITPSRGNTFNRPILALDENGNTLREYPSVREASRILGVNESAIYRCLRKNNPQAKCKGYLFRYKK